VIDVVANRLAAQHLVSDGLADAVTVVTRFAAVQAQDYPAAVWGIAQRTASLARADIDADYQSGRLIRTHVLRPTWHLVARDDLRWLLELSAPRVHQANRPIYRQEGLDGPDLARGEQLVVDVLAAEGALTRPQLGAALAERGFAAAGLRLGYVLMAAELDRLICSSGLIGKQHGYAVFDDRVPPGGQLDGDRALRMLALRYLEAHQPATAADLANWSGQTLGAAREALGLAADEVERHEIDALEYWSIAGALRTPSDDARAARAVHLLPNYDEYTVGYKNRENLAADFTSPPADGLFLRHIVLVDGLVSGGWRNVNAPGRHVIEVRLAIERDPRIERGIERAAAEYGRVNDVAVTVEYPS
jgi:hypothetical protein